MDGPQKESKAKLLGSLLLFTRYFFKIRTGRDFALSHPVSNESHFITVCRDLTKVFELEYLYEIINLPPGWGKSELCKHFVAWALAHYPDSNFLYISYSADLAEKHTHGIKQIIELPEYQLHFPKTQITKDTKAKGYFKTVSGGVIAAFGAQGSITGQDAGLPGLDRFSGAILMDDMHKPDEVHSDTTRATVVRNYHETIKPRKRGLLVPIIFVGQRLREDDLPEHLINGEDGNTWNKLIIEAEDSVGNARYPEVHSKEFLQKEKAFNRYVYWAQYMQNPQPADGGIYKITDFKIVDDEPKILSTFITVDTAETDKNYNDSTVFSFWGLHKVFHGEVETELYGLYWIDCLELKIEPKDLEPNFMQFYLACMRHSVKPEVIAIEKKSTGVTLSSVLGSYQGLRIMNIERKKSKTDRFLDAQPYVARKLISLPRYGTHTPKCIDHCKKITANETQRFDDIADTLADAVQLALIDKIFINRVVKKAVNDPRAAQLSQRLSYVQSLQKRAY